MELSSSWSVGILTKVNVPLQGKQWVRMVVLGQSFMMHQIRKMIGLAVAVARGAAPREAIGMALSPHRVFPVPMAPELGLFLDQTFFDAYNNRWGDDRDGKLTLDDYKQEVLDFKVRCISILGSNSPSLLHAECSSVDVCMCSFASRPFCIT